MLPVLARASRKVLEQPFGGLLSGIALRALSSVPETGSSTASLLLENGDSAGDALLLALPQRPFGAFARLPNDIITSSVIGSPARVGVLRPAFLPFDQAQPALSEVIAPLGPGAVALAASSQDPARRLLVDEYSQDGSGGYILSRPATELTAYLAACLQHCALVPDVSAAAAAAAAAGRVPNSVAAATGLRSMQSSNSVLMVAPTAFGFNEQAAADNSFMHVADAPQEGSGLTATVCGEFAELHRQLTDVAGVSVTLFQHHLSHGTPDAVFPNNWFSTHAAGEAAGGVGGRTLVLYPMKCPNRAAERRRDIMAVLAGRGYDAVVDLTDHERRSGDGGSAPQAAYFEGTGVLVLDRVNGVAYVALSERADAGLAAEWVQKLGYRDLVTFHSSDCRGKPVYHTNVMMAIGTDVAVVCADSVADEKERRHLLSRLSATHEVVQISLAQMDALCGNVLELQSGHGLPVMAMSSQAYNAFTPEQRSVMRRHVAQLVHAPIDTLERVGGGGVRCALAELF